MGHEWSLEGKARNPVYDELLRRVRRFLLYIGNLIVQTIRKRIKKENKGR